MLLRCEAQGLGLRLGSRLPRTLRTLRTLRTPYSLLSATVGSTLAARRAGITLAMKAATSNAAAAPASAPKLAAWSSKRNDWTVLVKYQADAAAYDHAGGGKPSGLADDHGHDAQTSRAERHADANLARALRHDIRHHAIDAHDGDRENLEHQTGRSISIVIRRLAVCRAIISSIDATWRSGTVGRMVESAALAAGSTRYGSPSVRTTTKPDDRGFCASGK